MSTNVLKKKKNQHEIIACHCYNQNKFFQSLFFFFINNNNKHDFEIIKKKSEKNFKTWFRRATIVLSRLYASKTFPTKWWISKIELIFEIYCFHEKKREE